MPAFMHAAAFEAATVDNSQGLKQAPDTVVEEAGIAFTSVGVEIACFCVAFAMIRFFSKAHSSKGAPLRHANKKLCDATPEPATTLQAWRSHKRTGPISGQELQHWAGRVIATEPESFVEEFIGHFAETSLPDDVLLDGVSTLMDVAAQAGQPQIVEAVTEAAKERLSVVVDKGRVHRSRLRAHAACGSERRVEELLRQEREQVADGTVTVRSLAVVVKGYLKAGKTQAAISQLQEMVRLGHDIPPRAMSELFAAAAKAGIVKETYASLGGQLQVPEDAVVALLDFAFQSEDFAFARDVEQLAKDQGTALKQEAFEAMLKLYVKVDDGKAIEIFQRMLSAEFVPCEGLCRYLMARCADSQNVRLAESVAEHLRGRQEMSLACYKTLMKVYALNGRYGKACELYDEIKQHGWEPDAVMYGSVVKFAAKAGRTDLAHELAEKLQGGCIRNYMWLIRS
eukprot:CAMPEP_0115420914 /NCGR_PEP_ID=MMETSP0271-20121206/25976_1 /TAXON_ID=71861 /ORGANISM="Scrippsiella trochoidea, Strain CCMP3099" /LENGTH=454 /DNA_ID=CAMNT_0002845529 /DNA_START=145 /DNA_END=1506 /DNA_ORIENTATION=-